MTIYPTDGSCTHSIYLAQSTPQLFYGHQLPNSNRLTIFIQTTQGRFFIEKWCSSQHF